MKQDKAQITRSFNLLAAAIQSGDGAMFEKIAAVPSDAMQQELFARNSKSLRMARLHLRLRRVEQQESLATAFFDVVDGSNVALDEGEIVFRQVGNVWLVDEL